jgi:hypothetical protein
LHTSSVCEQKSPLPIVPDLQLAPYAPALFSDEGMFPDVALLPTAAFPSPLSKERLHSPLETQAFVIALGVTATVLALHGLRCIVSGRSSNGVAVPTLCGMLWYGWAVLWNRNPWTSNPGLPMVGWILLVATLWQSDERGAPPIPREARHRWPASTSARAIGVTLLGVLGCTQLIAYYLEWPVVRGLAAATVASPLPLVFTAYHGHETFSNSFHYAAVDERGGQYKGVIGPELYSRFQVRGLQWICAELTFSVVHLTDLCPDLSPF